MRLPQAFSNLDGYILSFDFAYFEPKLLARAYEPKPRLVPCPVTPTVLKVFFSFETSYYYVWSERGKEKIKSGKKLSGLGFELQL